MATEKARSQRVNIRISPELSDKLDVWAQRMGVAPATLAAIALAEYLNTKETQRRAIEGSTALMARSVGNSLGNLFSDPEQLGQLAKAMLPDEHQLNLPDLGEEGSGSLD